MQSINQTKFLATHYSSLQGLRIVPVVLLFLLIVLWANSQFGVRAENITVPVILCVVAALIYILIDQYYKRTFGDVMPTLAARRIELMMILVAGAFALAAMWANTIFNLPFSLIGLLFAMMVLMDNTKTIFPIFQVNKFFVIRLVFSICLVLLNTSPLYSDVQWWKIFGLNSAFYGVSILFGVFMLVQGVISHIYFINSLPVAETENG